MLGVFAELMLGVFAELMLGVFAEFERAIIQKRVRAGIARARAHAIDLRLSLPLWRRSLYLVFLAGWERRTFDRRALERLFRQLSTSPTPPCWRSSW